MMEEKLKQVNKETCDKGMQSKASE